MKERPHCTPGVCPEAPRNVATVSIDVDPNHPLLQLKSALPWEALFEVMTRHWLKAGKKSMVDLACCGMSPYMRPWWC